MITSDSLGGPSQFCGLMVIYVAQKLEGAFSQATHIKMRLRDSEQKLKEVHGSRAALESELGLARERVRELESGKQLLTDEVRDSKAALASSLAAHDLLRKVIRFSFLFSSCVPFVCVCPSLY